MIPYSDLTVYSEFSLTMLKFLPGLLLMQAITVAILLLAPTDLSGWSWLRVLIPIVIVATLMAFWFGALASNMRQTEIQKLRETHAREREQIRVNAERDKHKVTKEAHQKIEQEIKRTTAKANFKVGMAVAGLAAAGGFLLLTQFMILGLLMVSTAGGTLGGYLLRIRQEKNKQNLSMKAPLEAKPSLPRELNPTPKKLPNKNPTV